MFLNKFFLSFVFAIVLAINTSANELFILPNQSKDAITHIENLILNSKEEIKISVYNFSYKKIANLLINAKKNNLEITVYFDSEKLKEDDEIYKLLMKNKIKTVVVKNKLHTKLAIFDKKTAYFGSANWTKKSFKENYEILYFTNDKKTISTLDNFLSTLN